MSVEENIAVNPLSFRLSECSLCNYVTNFFFLIKCVDDVTSDDDQTQLLHTETDDNPLS